MTANKLFFTLAFSLFSCSLYAQEDLLSLLDEEEGNTTETVSATFKGTRLINGHSVELRKKKELEFLISHRFGRLNSGGHEFFGLDAANIRLGLEYGLTDKLNVGIGRNSFEKTFDGFVKYKVLEQSSGLKNRPFSVVYFASGAYKSQRAGFQQFDASTEQRFFYTHQLLIARKFSPSLSLQLMPTIVHRNLVSTDEDDNTLPSLGFGGRMKLTKRVSINWEYYYQFTENQSSEVFDVVALGFDIETGGHVFQLHLTNAQAMIEKGFITETTGDISEGDIHFGFNISRTFNLGGK